MPENLYTPHSIRTFTGKYFDFTVMDPDTICIEDIAHALSNMPRFSGHTPKFYSVAQHCVNACLLAPEHESLDALLHDATEAYMLDIAKPLKNLLPDYSALEKKLEKVIAHKFQVFAMNFPTVKGIDAYLLEREFNGIINNDDNAWTHEFAKQEFLRFYEIYKRV